MTPAAPPARAEGGGLHAERLQGVIRSYAWGSRTALARWQGRSAPTPEPEAELWIGAHPLAPAQLADGGSLIDWIQAAPEQALGAGPLERFGPQLPFLLKWIAVEQPLSLQAHPDAEQARAGFERENAAGLAPDSPLRNYRDPNPKPELLCAQGPFEALCGFRPAQAIRADLEALGLAPGEPLLRTLCERGHADFFRDWMQCEPARRAALLARLVAAARSDDAPQRWLRRLAQLHPGDPGLLAPLLLNFVRLEAGEAIFLRPGELHAYLHGVAVEVMACSDNVLRGGLTPKHVDVAELLAVLRCEAAPPRRSEALRDAEGVLAYVCGAAEFELSRIELAPGECWQAPARRSAEVLLCSAGAARIAESGRPDLDVPCGAAAIVPACAPGYSVRAHADGEPATLQRVRIPS